MRNRAGKIVIDLNQAKKQVTASIDYPTVPSLPQIIEEDAFINENETVYALFPYELNDPPIFTKSVYAASTPQSLHIESYTPQLAGKVLFHDSEGVVKVLEGSNLVLRVEAIQPNVLNVENGVPTLIQRKEKLSYDWTYNGESLSEEEGFIDIFQRFTEVPRIVDSVEIDGNQLILKNVTDKLNGTYVCIVINDIGEISSEAIELQVIHTNKFENTYFRQNLVKNAFARDSTNEWTAIQGSIAVQPFALREAESELKKPSTPLRQHSVNEIYPHPISIGVNGIKGYKLSTLATETSFYFTKAPYAKYADGGRPQSVVYQDIDVSEIQDLIAGRVFGCNGVRAYFGCVIGNSIEYRAMDVLTKSNPNDPKYFYQAAPRLSFENAVLTGLPRYSGEAAHVLVQEFEGNTQISSRRYVNESRKAERVDNVTITDPLTTARESNASFYMKKVERPEYLNVFAAGWEGNTSIQPLVVSNHILNPQNPPAGVGESWFNTQTYNFSPYNAGTTTLQSRLDPVYWPPESITETYRSEMEWIGSDPTRILNTYDQLFYGHLDAETKRASYYSYGQYAEYKDAVITALNPRTTKIRISIVFESWYDGNTDANYPTLYAGWDRPQAKHEWWIGDPLIGNWPVDPPPRINIGTFKSPKIMWQTILDNRHLEKVRTIPITEDAGYKNLIQARLNIIKAYPQAISQVLNSSAFTLLIDRFPEIQAFKDHASSLAASNYNPSDAQRKKDYSRLAQLAAIAKRRLLTISLRFPGTPFAGAVRMKISFTTRLIGIFLSQLSKKSAEIANYVKNYNPINDPKLKQKREEAWAEMDVIQHERVGKKETTAMVTALGLILEPITSGTGDISTFRSSILRMPTKQEDLEQRPKPLNILQTPSARQFKIVALEKL